MSNPDRIRVAEGATRPKRCHHVRVFGKKDVFAGHPFNAGFNQFGDGDEMVVAYSTRRCTVHRLPDGALKYPTHASGDSGRSRTTDGGKTWRDDTPFPFLVGGAEDCLTEAEARNTGDVKTRAIDPHHPDHGIHCAGEFVYTTRDRGKTWTGPSFLPKDGVAQCWNRPVYLARPDGVLLTFPTVSRRTGDEGRVFVYASYDGGVTWSFLSIMAQSDDYMLIMPTVVNLPSGRLLAAVRVHLNLYSPWTEMYDSDDGGVSWRFIGRLNDHGMPSQLARLQDGRIAAVYGYRLPPYGIRARVSEDEEGWRWGPELILRDDALTGDLGYPRGGVARDGAMVACYYFHETRYPKPPDCDAFHWGTRSIWATRFWA